MINDVINKISQYNLFNYLLPGGVFVALVSSFSEYNLIQQDLIIGLFFYYFIGMVISRIGSVFVEPVLKKFKFLQFEEYGKYLSASDKDTKLEALVEANNVYRTFVSVFLCLLLLKFYSVIEQILPFLAIIQEWLLILLLLVLFLFSYRKQTNYISSRIRKNSDVE